MTKKKTKQQKLKDKQKRRELKLERLTPIEDEALYIFKNTRENKGTSRKRYISACLRFVTWVFAFRHVQHVKNIKQQHIQDYVDNLLEKGKSLNYIRTDICGIFFMLERAAFLRYLNELKREEISYDNGRDCTKEL